MGDPARSKTQTATPEEEKATLLKELAILSDRKDAIDKMLKARRQRLQTLMNEGGERTLKGDWGTAAFKPKRVFSVPDRAALGKLKKDVLVEGFKPNAKLVDALSKRGVSIKGIITIGVNETFEYARPRGKEAEARRKEAIAQSMQEAEAKVADIMERI